MRKVKVFPLPLCYVPNWFLICDNKLAAEAQLCWFVRNIEKRNTQWVSKEEITLDVALDIRVYTEY